MIWSDIWHKCYDHELHFEIIIRNFTSREAKFETILEYRGIYAKYHVQIMLLFFYTATLKGL